MLKQRGVVGSAAWNKSLVLNNKQCEINRCPKLKKKEVHHNKAKIYNLLSFYSNTSVCKNAPQ